MPAENDALVLDLVAWVAARPRPYGEVMAAWQTHCPRLTIWEDALDEGYVACGHHDSGASMVSVTPAGRALLRHAGRLPRTRAA